VPADPSPAIAPTSPLMPPAPQAAHAPHAPPAPPAPRRGKAALAALAAVLALLAAAAGVWAAFFRPSLEIVDVQARSAVAGNGKPTEVLLSYRARNVEIRAIEVRFVRGDGHWSPSSWNVPFDGSTREQGLVPAGHLSQRTSAPMRATFEYVLVTRSGRHSAPLEKTFEIMPPAAITQAVAPARVQPGQPYSVKIAYRKGGAAIVKVQRRVVDSDMAWDAPEHATDVQLDQASGTLDLPFDAPGRPMRATLEFTLVDALGIASEPVRVNVATSAPAAAAAAAPVALSGQGTVLSVVRVAGASGVGIVAGAAAGGALANKIGKGSGRDLATVLGAVSGGFAGHQIEQNISGATLWETTVQLDAGGVTRVRHGTEPQWTTGSRVRVVGGVVML
jgi:outer membrane lipoprotein SlyB